jgi:hypothetical protein
VVGDFCAVVLADQMLENLLNVADLMHSVHFDRVFVADELAFPTTCLR